jgi:hypothetical protein
MALLQALFSLLSRSLGKILNSIFGWAVVALFGQTTPAQKTLLSGLVGLAALWPLLLLGVAFPHVGTAVLAFVPRAAQGPGWVMRLIWIGLAIVVPLLLGLVVASKAPPGTPAEPFVKRALRGYPITLALAAAFVLTFVSVPVLRLSAILKRRKDEHVPLVTSADGYDDVAARIDAVLQRQHIDAARAEPPWWLAGPSRILLKLGGRAFRGFIPQDLAYWNGPVLEVALYPSDLLLRGAPRLTAFTHGVVTEDLARSAALQTFDPAAQELEQQLRRVWRIYEENPAAHRRSPALLRRLDDLTDRLGTIDVPYEEWSILYRQLGQLSRAIDGQQQLLAKGRDMAADDKVKVPGEARVDAPRDVSGMSSPKLVMEVTREALTLIRSEMDLAKVELKEDLRGEIAAAKQLSVAAVAALSMLNLLLVAAAFGLARVMPDWAAALVVAAVMAVVAGVAGAVGWKHVKVPLARTRKSLEEDVRWVKERTA